MTGKAALKKNAPRNKDGRIDERHVEIQQAHELHEDWEKGETKVR